MTAPAYELLLETDAKTEAARLRLLDRNGVQVGAHQVRFGEHPPSLWEGLFDTREHVRRYEGSTGTAEEILERLGVFLGDSVLGPEITGALAQGVQHRTLLVHLPETGRDPMAAAFARLPWEIARPAPGEKPLFERNLVVRAVTDDMGSGPWTVPAPTPDETVRVLLVFSEAPGSRPLAMRLEREGLLDLFYDDILPNRRVEVDVLCHGVTRELLRRRIEDRSGYHVVHWSGHGHHDLLELYGDDGKPDRISGEELLELFGDAGGFLPRLVVLSACLSGTLVKARSWDELRGALREADPTTRATEATGDGLQGGERALAEDAALEAVALPQLTTERPGCTGTAMALLRAGVPQVVAMRYEVGDAYARELGRLFYRYLLADTSPKSPARALSLARKALARKTLAGRPDPAFHPVDHATPLVFGREVGPLHPPAGRSPALEERRPRPQPLLVGSRELDRPERFVGRGRELTHLRTTWLAREGPAVALVQGLAGLGKTALAAEAIHLWHRDFDGVFAFQSKPTPLSVDELLTQLDRRLALHSPEYEERSRSHPNGRIYLPPREDLQGEERYRLLRDNLLEALRSHRLLLVLDNFETQLEELPTDGGYACANPEWDRLLSHLAKNLPGTGSRLLITTRHRPASLSEPDRADRTLWIPLGPLPMDQAILFIQAHPALRDLAYSGDGGWRLVVRLLTVSRGHPLILTRLAALAGDPEALEQALDTLTTAGLAALPDLFDEDLSDEEQRKEHDYLEDVAVRSVDLLLERLTPDARRLLWVVTLAGEPVDYGMIEGVWSGETVGASTPAPAVEPLLTELTAAGLLHREIEDGGAYAFHELVRERTAAWMERHPDERRHRTEAEIWTAYGERYANRFQDFRTSGAPGSRDQAAELGRRGLAHLVQARAFDRLGSFASGLVTGTRDPVLLREVIARLRGVVDELPPGRVRWSVRTYLADALRRGGRPDGALPFYRQAADEAEKAEHWMDLGWICQNWAVALRNVSQLDAAQATYLRSAEAEKQAGSPRVGVLGSELEALRIDILRGDAENALPEVERRLDEIRTWWNRHRAGKPVPEAPDPIFLGRAYVAALDIAGQANLVLKHWQACLVLLEEIEQAERALGEGAHELAVTRLNRSGPLLRLGRLDEAQDVLEGCLEVFRDKGDPAGEGQALTALANLWKERGDLGQAIGLERQALSIRNSLPALGDRAISHNNLANYLTKTGEIHEAAGHRLAAIVYAMITGHGQLLKDHRRNLALDMHRTAAAGETYPLPRLADLLARPELSALQQTLAAFEADPEQLQAAVDQFAEEIQSAIDSGTATETLGTEDNGD